jgi:hypothetical protein
MNKKTARRYELIAALVAKSGDAVKNLEALAENDFLTAFEMFEFLLSQGGFDSIVPGALTMFLKSAESRTRSLFSDSQPLCKLVFTGTAATDPVVTNFLIDYILANKIDAANECLNQLRANTNLDYGETMRAFIDKIFAAYCARNNVRVPQFNRKQKELLLSHIEKIKGPNKALLIQRMKEI